MSTPVDVDNPATKRCYIRAVPTEVLCEIFRTAQHTQRFPRIDDLNGRYPFLVQISISHVCRHWRDISLQLPDLWTTLLIVRDRIHFDFLDAFLQRSQSQPLDIIVRWCPRRYEDEVMGTPEASFAVPVLSVLSMLITHSPRWRSLDLIADTGDAVNFVLEQLRPLRVPLLRRLGLQYITAVPHETRYEPWQNMDPGVPFDLFGAQLEELSIGAAYVDWDYPISDALGLTGLKSLTLGNTFTEVNPTIPQLFTILSGCPNLTTLVCGAVDDEPIQLSIPIELGALQSLEFTSKDTPVQLFTFLQNLSAPMLRSFSLKSDVLSGKTVNALMGRELDLEWTPTPLPTAPSFLQRICALRIRTPMTYLTEQWRLAFYERMQDVRVLILESTPDADPDGLKTALSDLVNVAPPNSASPAALLPNLTTLVVTAPEPGLLRPFVEGRKNAGLPLKRLFSDFAADISRPEVGWLEKNLEVLGITERFRAKGDGNVEAWLALDAEPVGTVRARELCTDVGCLFRSGRAFSLRA
ncbi:hypothetical protein EWM64_g1055 [Hericium alpestre]|uniref:Uncharacterized protein n=1 Tax=Hericium alpestre TaxID=135208 RepID=A0A4Z0ABI3_9AGAM|nr:hypothetical protein EWM64_g1055 [Hericium alpestre]